MTVDTVLKAGRGRGSLAGCLEWARRQGFCSFALATFPLSWNVPDQEDKARIDGAPAQNMESPFLAVIMTWSLKEVV